MNKPLSYKIHKDDPDYVLIHKRALVAMSHCMGLALKSYSISSGQDMQEVTRQLSYLANCHAYELSQSNLDFVINQLIEHQGESGVIELKDLINDR